MKRTEIILASIFLLSLIMGLFWIPLGSELLILSVCGLAMLYQFLSFALLTGIRLRNVGKKQSFAAVSGRRIAISIVAGISFSIALIGLLFKFMRWPNAHQMLLMGVVPLVVIGGISIIKLISTNDAYYKKMLIRIGIIAGLTIAFMIAPYFWFDLKYRDYPDYRAAVKAANANPNDAALQQKEDEEYDKAFRKDY
jgi:hypothetical protein